MDLSAFRNLFGDLQEYVVGILNQDELIDAMGAKFVSENALDIEYEVKDALAKTGMACVVMTPTATYQGHNGIQQTFTCDELTLQIVENPVVRRPWLKKNSLAYGTGLDVAKAASDRLAGPQGGHFGQFTTKRIQEAEQSGLLVVTATFGCTVYETLSAVPSGDISGHWVEVPFVRISDLSDWIDEYISGHVPVPSISGYLPLSGGTMTGGLTFDGYDAGISFTYDGIDGGQIVQANDGPRVVYGDQQWCFSRRTSRPDQVLRRSDLSDVPQPDMSAYVRKDNETSAYVKVLGNNADTGFSVVDVNGNPFIQTADDRRTDVYNLSARTVEVGDALKSSSQAWDFIRKNSGSVTLQQTLDGMMAEVQEDYVTYNWINQQDFIKDADLSGVWKKTDTQLTVGLGAYTTNVDPGAVTIQRLLNGTLTKTMQNWDGFTYTISSTGGTPANYNFTYPLSGGVIATRQYVDAFLGDISALIHET